MGRPKKTWLKVVIEQSRKVGLNKSDVIAIQDGD